jgi:hypothetical protein
MPSGSLRALIAAPLAVVAAGLAIAPIAVLAATVRPQSALAQASSNREVVVTELRATLTIPVTTYLLTAQDPALGALLYSWTMTATSPLGYCGTPKVPWTRSGSQVPWSHYQGPPDSCVHQNSPNHPVKAVGTVTVLDGPDKGATAVCTLVGSETQVIDNPASACTFTAAAAPVAPPVVPAAVPPAPATHTGGSNTGLLGAAAAAILAVGAGIVVLIRRKPGPGLVVAGDPEADWKAYVSQEQTIQTELLASFQGLMSDVATSQASYNAAFDQYRTTYARVLSGSTEMQGMMQAWMESKDTLEKADLAFAILTLLVSGVGLGLKGIQLLRGARITAATVDAARAAQAARATEGALTATEAVVTVAKGQPPAMANVEAKIAASLAREARVSLTETVARHGGDMTKAVAELSQKVFSQRGWHYLADTAKVAGGVGQKVDVAQVVSRVVTNSRAALGAASRRAAMTTAVSNAARAGGVYGPSAAQLKSDIEILKQLQALEPKFLQSLKTAVVDMVEPALSLGQPEAGSALLLKQLDAARKVVARAPSVEAIANVERLEELVSVAEHAASLDGKVTVRILTDADHALLMKMVETGGDLAKVEAALGPAQVILLEEIVGRAGVTIGSGVSAEASREAMLNTFETGTAAHITDAAHFVNEFGVANRIDASSNVVTFMGGELWHLVSAPFTTVGEHWYSHEALDVQAKFMKDHGADLQALASALQESANALGRMQRAIKNAHLDDPASALGGRGASDLRKVVEQMKRALDAGGPDFRQRHEPEYHERAAHIEQKLATLRHATDELKALAAKLPQMEKWLNELRLNADGSARPVTEGIDPNALMRIGSGFLYLNGVMGSLASGQGSTTGVAVDQAPPAPTTTEKAKPDCSKLRSAWGSAHRALQNLESQDTVAKAREALTAAKAEEASARRDVAARAPDGTYPSAVRTDGEKAEYDAGRQAAQARVAEAVQGVTAAQEALAEAEKTLADTKAEEEATRKALEDCEKAGGSG